MKRFQSAILWVAMAFMVAFAIPASATNSGNHDNNGCYDRDNDCPPGNSGGNGDNHNGGNGGGGGNGGNGGNGGAGGASNSDSSAQAKAIADALAGANAELAAKIWSTLTASQKTQVATSLSSDQRNDLQNAINNSNVNKATGGAGGAGGVGNGGAGGKAETGPVTAGGAQVQNLSSIRNITLNAPGANAPNLPSQVGNFVVETGSCAPARKYTSFKMKLVHRRAILDDKEVDVNTGLYVIDQAAESQAGGQPTWEILGEEGDLRIVRGERTRAVVAMVTASGSNGMSISLGGSNAAGSLGGSGGTANSFSTAYYLEPLPCYEKQVKLGKGWVPEWVVGKTEPKPAASANVKLETEKVRTFDRVPYACWYGDPAKKPATAPNGAPVRQCNRNDLAFGERIVPLVDQEVERVKRAAANAEAQVK